MEAGDVASKGCLVAGAVVFIFGVMMFSALWGSGSKEAAATTTSGGGPVESTTYKPSQEIIDKIKENLPVYQAAAAKVGIAWEMLAGLHFRESTLSPAGPSGEAIGSPSPEDGKVKCSSFQECEIVKAEILKHKAKTVYGVELTASSTGEDLKKALVGYNRGSMYKTGGCSVDSSPYVMNQFDAAHKNMRWPNNECEPTSTRGEVNVPAGAYTIFAFLRNGGLNAN